MSNLLYNTGKLSTPDAILIDDHLIFAESFGRLLEESSLFNAIHFFSNHRELISHLIENRNGRTLYLFIDYYLEDTTLPTIINSIKRSTQNAKLIVLSCISNPALINNLISFNLDGIIHKSSPFSTVLDAISDIKKGRKYYCNFIRSAMEKQDEGENSSFLTNREIEILEHFAKALSVDQTADVMNLSRHTIAAHRRKMFHKTNSSNITELLAYARKIALI